jgi:hypothetical protein
MLKFLKIFKHLGASRQPFRWAAEIGQIGDNLFCI